MTYPDDREQRQEPAQGASCKACSETKVPSGMREVTKGEFYAAMRGNVHPTDMARRETYWRNLNTRRVVGWASEGFAGPFEHEGIRIVYAVAGGAA